MTTVALHGRKPLAGIGGWLALLGVGITLAPLAIIGSLSQYHFAEDTRVAWSLFPAAMGLELAMNLGFLALSAMFLIAFYGKRVSFPGLFRVYVVAAIAITPLTAVIGANAIARAAGPTFGEAFASMWTEEQVSATIRALAVGCVWLPYVYRSRRVANTFTR